MFSCNLHEFSGFGDACPKCLKELAERHASKTETEFPTTPAAPEWDGMLPENNEWSGSMPPINKASEVDHERMGAYIPCFVHGYKIDKSDGIKVVYEILEGEFTGVIDAEPAGLFRPIRTNEQRQREELSDLITDNIKVDYTDGNFYIDDDKAVNAILSRYNLEPKL